MKYLKIFLIILLSNLLLAEYPKRILFVGNSYLYYNDSVHNHVERMLIEYYDDEDIITKSATIGGSRLNNHNIEHLLDYKNLQLDRQIDLLIMQGGSKEVTTSELRSIFTDTAVNYSKKAQKIGIQTALYMTHAYLDNDPRYEKNLIKKIKLAYYDAGKKSNSKVAPVGIAYEMAYKERPNIMLHHPDGTHPGLLGTYLGSYVVFSMITNSSPEGLKYNYLNQISEKDLTFLQEIAWKAYLEHKKQYN
tara:strand:- start:1762 stop:2505 length:744 start_codon:yes stop_codon:yes gene_type:complete